MIDGPSPHFEDQTWLDQEMRVVGVDGWKKQWVAVVLDDGVFADAATCPTIGDVADRYAGAAAIGIDIPIGFATHTPRRADQAARQFIGARRSSVFNTLPEAVYRAPSYAEASQISQRLWGKGISQQAYALRTKVLEVAECADPRFHEVHPEVSFAALAGGHIDWSKKTWNGQNQRRRLLAGAGIDLPDLLPSAGQVPVDDVLDAAVCAWTASRICQSIAHHLPADPAEGEPVIWY